MNTLRLSTLSLTLAIAMMTLGYVNPSIADKPGMGGHSHGGNDPEDVAEYSVAITGDVVAEVTKTGAETSAGKRRLASMMR